MKLRIVVAYALLLSFFVVLTPRELWHECDHHHDIENSNETHFENGDCFACDFGLSVVSQPQIFTYYFIKTNFEKVEIALSSSYFKKKFKHFPHRGPPTIS